MCLHNFMSTEICTLANFQKKLFRPEISTPFYGVLKSKNAQKGHFFRKNDIQSVPRVAAAVRGKAAGILEKSHKVEKN